MERFYSQSTGCTYLKSLHAVMPEDVVLIDDERYDTVIANPEPLKVRAHDGEGRPILIDAAPLGAIELAEQERAWRDGELATRQWLRDRHRDEQDLERETTLSADQFAELLGYLQDLRDWPQSDQFPVVEHRPVAPSWIADQSQ